MVYIQKLCIAILYVIVFSLYALVSHVYHTSFGTPHLQEASVTEKVQGIPVIENIGLSCLSNVFLGCFYSILFICWELGRKLYLKRHPSSQENERQPVYCISVDESEAETSSHFQFDVKSSRANAVYITPAMLWYYMYTLGVSIFCLTYALHASENISSTFLCLSSLICCVWLLVEEDSAGLKNIEKPYAKGTLLIVLSTLNLLSMILFFYQVSTLVSDDDGSLRKAMWRNWGTVLVFPILTPFWIAQSRQKVKFMQMPSQKVVLFGLPFVGVLSACFLSVYLPTLTSFGGDEPLNNSTLLVEFMGRNSTSLWNQMQVWNQIQIAWNGSSPHWVLHITGNHSGGVGLLDSFVGVFATPAIGFVAFVVYTGSFLNVHNFLICTQSLWMVFVWKQVICFGMGEGTLFLVSALTASISWLLSILYLFVHIHVTEHYKIWQNIYEDINFLLPGRPSDSFAEEM